MGISYNPISIFKHLERIISKDIFSENDLFNHNEQWKSHELHSEFSDANQVELLNKINQEINQSHETLKRSKMLILSFGTAYVFNHINEDRIYNNCHKIDGKKFEKRLLKAEEIIHAFNKIEWQLEEFNPNLQILFTVSPIRHQKDGLINNNISKSTLILATQEIISKRSNSHYFPSYEIMMDDLRDYRFYKEDMLHPSQLAIDYIWKKFKESFFSQECIDLCTEIESLNQSLNHRPLNPNSTENHVFQDNLKSKLKKIQLSHPYLKF